MKKVAWFVTHPVQYYSPMFKIISEDKEIDFNVCYFSDFSTKGYKDKEFGKVITWCVPLLEGYKSKVLKNYGSKKHGTFFSYINFGIYNEIKKNNYDLVIINGWNTFSYLLVILSCVLTTTPYSLRGDTNSFAEKEKKGFRQFFRKLYLKIILNTADVIFYIGKQNKKFYNYLKIPENKLFEMPYTVNNDYFSQYIEKIDIEHEKEILGVKTDEKVILFSGKLIEKKQCVLLIQALHEINSNYILLILGDGEEKEKLVNLANELNINVLFLGFINQQEIPKYYWLSDILVMPSNYEPWGLSINEAMNCGCAIVASDRVGSADDLLQENGFIFKNGSVVDLQNKLSKLLNDEKLLHSCQEKSSKIIQECSYKNDLEALQNYFSFKDNIK